MGAGAFGCAGPASDAKTLTLAHGLDVTHPVHRAMEHLAARLAELSGGALRAEIFPGEQLGSERECLELLQIGSVAMTKVSASVLESFAPAFAVFNVPYLFRDRAHETAVLEGPIGRELLLSAERFRLRGLAYYDAGSRSFYTRARPIRHPDDLAGLKIRTQESPSAIRMVQLLGGSPTPISWGELYTALQQGVVDGAENNPPSFHLSHHYEVCRHYALDEHTAVPDVLLAGTDPWQRLAEREREWLAQAAAESAVLQTELWRVATEEALAAVAAAGVEVTRPDKGPFVERVVPFQREVAKDPALGGWVRRILELAP
ncbi:MAG TPA: TRAP transporter substrate-binding protein [Thermoanaerobaculia bacterium]|nr:TRAP transporter substrate-binding protein [Thermoanaerobaculia bacterium]